MNILLATPIYSTHYDSGWFWFRALQQMGHNVIVWDYRLDKNPPPTQHYPDVVLVLKGEGIDPRRLPSPKVVYWPDALERTPGIEEVLQHYDKVFTPVRPTPDGMIWLPTGHDSSVHRDLGMDRVVDTIYIGTANSDYKVKTVSGISPKIIVGNEWRSHPIGTSQLNVPVYLHDFVKVANQAKILIDVHQSPKVGLNRKLFEMASCGFTIVDRVPGVEEILGWGLTNQVSFTNVDKAKELIRYYLERPKEREETWLLQREKIQEYTYQKAVEKILVYLK